MTRSRTSVSALVSLLLAGGMALAPAETPPAKPTVTSPNGIVAIEEPAAGEVLKPGARDDLLQAVARDLHRDNPALVAQVQAVDNPFYPAPPPPPPPDNTPAPSAPAPPPKATDADVLAAVAQLLKPSGTMSMGDQYVLVFADRSPLQVGQVIRVNTSPQTPPADVVISAIKDNSYTLKLNSSELPVRITEAVPSDQPPPSTPSPNASPPPASP
jgi:hypothetical protein